jgi:hypothetical protein
MWVAIKRATRKETRMKTKLLPKDPYGLVAFAEALVAVLARRREDLGITIDVEVLLRASIGAATYTTDAYFAVLSSANQSPEAAGYLAEAKRLRDRSVKQLRRRITRAILELRRRTRNRDFAEIAHYVASKAS